MSRDNEHAVIEHRAYRIIPGGVYTVQGPKGHRTFSVEMQAEDAEWAPGRRVVYLLTGSGDDTRDWTSFAFVNDPRGVDLSAGTQPAPYEAGALVSHISVFRKYRAERVSAKMASGASAAGREVRPSIWEDYADLLWRMIVRGERDIRRQDGKTYRYRLLLAKSCIRCGRRLSTPDSIDAGIGSECRKKMAS